MNISQSFQLLLIIVATISFTFAEEGIQNRQHIRIDKNEKPNNKNNGNDAFSDRDFKQFLQDMESIVFKQEKPKNLKKVNPKKFQQITTISHLNVTKNSNIFHSRKAALREVLMLKLVSYYEDKYKLTIHESTTTPMTPPPSTTRPTTTVRTRLTAKHLMEDAAIVNDVLNDIDDKASGEVVVI